MNTRIMLAAAILLIFGSSHTLAADTAEKDAKSSKLTDSPTYKEIQRQGNRIGDEIGKNIGQGFRNANEGFKKRFNTNKPEEK
ncbi:MAG TPA: hypothetical protein VFA38_05505 [Nitrospirales bacterium]|nr:hypothetical protein [Nitrospirales bacterium]